MKKYMVLLCLFATACTNSSKDNTPAAAADDIPVTEISISKLQSLNGDVSVDADSVELHSSVGSRVLEKRVRIKNNTDGSKTMNLSVVNTSNIVMKVNRCPSQLEAGKSCEISIAQLLRKTPNGVSAAFLKVLDDGAQPFGVTINSNIQDSDYKEPTTDGSLEEDVSVAFTNFDDYSSGLDKKKVTLTNDSKSESVINVNYQIPSGYKIALSRCDAILEYRKSCDLFLVFVGPGTPSVDDEFVIQNGSSSKTLILITKPTVTAIGLASDKKSFNITGDHFERVKTVKLVKESGELVDNLVIGTRSNTALELKPSQTLNIVGGKYKFKME